MPDSHSAPNQSSASERLSQFVKKRLDDLSEHLPEGPEPPNEATLREVQFLRELTQLSADSRPPTSARKRSFGLPILIAITMICIGLALYVPLRTVTLDLDLLCSSVRFRTAARIELNDHSVMALLGASELAPLTLENPETLASWQVDGPIKLRPGKDASLAVSSIVIPADSSVSLSATANAGTWRVAIEHEHASVGTTARGTVQVAGSHFDRRIQFGRGSLIQMRATSAPPHRLGVFLTPNHVETPLASEVIPVAEIAFEKMVQSGLPGVAGIIRGDTSSIIEGSIINVTRGNDVLPLKKRDNVQISLVIGSLRELKLEQAGIRLSLTGDATEILVGRAGVLQSQRPSYLEWWAQRHTLQVAWASAFWLFGLLWGGLQWWKNTDA